MESKNEGKLKALVVYFSGTGNTEKVANAIRNGLEKEKVKPTLLKVQEAAREELYDYDLVFLGSPNYEWLPAQPVMRFIQEKMQLHRQRGDIKLCAPRIPSKTAVVFCTYSGPHTGINEALSTGKYMGQLFEHLGFEVAGEWYIVGEQHAHPELSVMGKGGDIRGRPNEQDLSKVENDASKLVRSILAAPR